MKLNKRKRAVDLVRSVLRIISPDLPSVPLLKRVGEEPAVAPSPAQPR